MEKARWTFCETTERMIPIINCIHVVPVGDSGDCIHVASNSCWCNPKPSEDNKEQIFLHNALTGNDHEGWILIGERINL